MIEWAAAQPTEREEGKADGRRVAAARVGRCVLCVFCIVFRPCLLEKKTETGRYDFEVRFHGGSLNRTKKSPL